MRPLPFLLLVACADRGTTEASGLADEVAALTATIDDLTDRLEAAEARLATLEGRPDDTDAPDVGPWPARGTVVGTVTPEACIAWQGENGGDPGDLFVSVDGLVPPGPPTALWEERPTGWFEQDTSPPYWSCVDDQCGYKVRCSPNFPRHLVIN